MHYRPTKLEDTTCNHWITHHTQPLWFLAGKGATPYKCSVCTHTHVHAHTHTLTSQSNRDEQLMCKSKDRMRQASQYSDSRFFPFSCVLTSGPAGSWKERAGSCFSPVSVALVPTLASVHSVASRCPCGYTDGTTEWKHSQWLYMYTDGASESRRVKIHVHISFQWGWTRILSWTRVFSHNFVSSFAVRARVIFCFSSRWTRGEVGRGRLTGLRLVVENACTCWTLIACQLHGGPLCCLSVHCV